MYYFTAFFTLMALSKIHLIYGGVQEDVLIEHNRLRRLHGVPDLELDYNLSAGAQNHAKLICNLDEVQFSEFTDAYDENLCCDPAEDHNPLLCVRDWYNEIKNYDFNKGEDNPECGNFIALVWKESNKLGVGQAKGNDSIGEQMCLVTRYFPRSFVNSDYKENVPRLVENSTISESANINFSSIVWNPFKYLALLTFSWLAIF